MINRLITFILCSLTMAALSVPAVAQSRNPYDEQSHDSYGEPYSSKYYRQTPWSIALSLARKPYLPDGHFALVMAVKDVVTGCPKLSDLSYEAEFTDIFLDITIDDYIVDLRDAPRNPHYECKQTYQIPQAEIIMSRDGLAANNTQQIRFQTKTPYEYYDIELSEHKVRLIPSITSRKYKALKLSNVVSTLTHWFYPEGTIILYLPEALPDHKKLEESLMVVAEKHGLVPLTSIYPDFRSPISTPYHYYYVDQIGKTVSEIEKTGGGYLDKIHTETISYELEGDVPILKEMAVYVKKPGMYE